VPEQSDDPKFSRNGFTDVYVPCCL
jgi:hypothetical protein